MAIRKKIRAVLFYKIPIDFDEVGEVIGILFWFGPLLLIMAAISSPYWIAKGVSWVLYRILGGRKEEKK